MKFIVTNGTESPRVVQTVVGKGATLLAGQERTLEMTATDAMYVRRNQLRGSKLTISAEMDDEDAAEVLSFAATPERLRPDLLIPGIPPAFRVDIDELAPRGGTNAQEGQGSEASGEGTTGTETGEATPQNSAQAQQKGNEKVTKVTRVKRAR